MYSLPYLTAVCESVWKLLAPSTGIEPVTYRLGGGRSILLSYEGIVLRLLDYLDSAFLEVSIVFFKETVSWRVHL